MENEKIINITEVCTHYDLDLSFVYSLRDYGLIDLIEEEQQFYIRSEALTEIERMMHLHFDLEINLAGIEAISHLLQRVNEMQKELILLRNRLGK